MNDDRNRLYVELQEMVDQGTILFLDGHLSSPELVTYTLCAEEEACYMRDYIYDEQKGVLRELHFDKLNEI